MASEMNDETSSPAFVHGGRGEGGATSNAPEGPEGDSASSVDHVETKEPPVTRKQKLQRHCGKYWLYYLIGNIIFLAILLPLM